jgi:heme/copper-type cytochrome/quinol oxidase subunit 2
MSKTKAVYGILIALAALGVAFAPFPANSALPATRTFKVKASQFSYSPSEFHAEPGDTVTFELTSTDVVHGLYVDGYDLSVQADPGQTARLTFVADRPGSFRLRCNVTCGAMHPFMIGRLNVGTNDRLLRAIGLALLATVASLVFVTKPN